MTCSHIILTAARARVTEEDQLRAGRLVWEEPGVHLCYYGWYQEAKVTADYWDLYDTDNADNGQEATQR